MTGLRRWLARLLWAIAAWVDVPMPAADLAPLEQRALELARQAEAWQDVSDEYKRHRAYAKLAREFPALRRRQLSQAIERAVELL